MILTSMATVAMAAKEKKQAEAAFTGKLSISGPTLAVKPGERVKLQAAVRKANQSYSITWQQYDVIRKKWVNIVKGEEYKFSAPTADYQITVKAPKKEKEDKKTDKKADKKAAKKADKKSNKKASKSDDKKETVKKSAPQEEDSRKEEPVPAEEKTPEAAAGVRSGCERSSGRGERSRSGRKEGNSRREGNHGGGESAC